MLAPGTKVDRYTIEEPLGTGGMGVVYCAYDAKLRRRVALKVIRVDDAMPESQRSDRAGRMRREARAAAALSHPNVVTIFDVGEANGMPFIAMELLKGTSLRNLLNDKVALPRRVRWILDIAGALAAAHTAGLVHRDVKPENVMVLESDVIKMLDFGVARLEDAAPPPPPYVGLDVAPQSFRTAPGHVMGTPKYMAPEQTRGYEVDARVDQFGWGLVAYELLALRHPRDVVPDFSQELGWAKPARPLLEIAPAIAPRVARVIMRALDRDRANRYASMDDLVSDLAVAAPELDTRRRAGSEPARAPEELTTASERLPALPSTGTAERWSLAGAQPGAPPAVPGRGGRRLLGSAVALAAAIGGAWMIVARLAAPAPPAVPVASAPARASSPLLFRCAIPDANIVDLELPLATFGLVATDDGALLGATVPVSTKERIYAATARPDHGGSLRRRLSLTSGVATMGTPALIDGEPHLAMYSNSNVGGGAFLVFTADARDPQGSFHGQLAGMRTELGAKTLLAAEGGARGLLAAVGGSETRSKRLADGEVGARQVPVVRAFGYEVGRPLVSSILAEDAELLALDSNRENAAALVSSDEEISIVYFDRSARTLGRPVSLARRSAEEGAIVWLDDRVFALWVVRAGPNAPSRWFTSTVDGDASASLDVPDSDDSGAPAFAKFDGGVAAAWVRRTARGTELRFAAVRDPNDLQRASIAIRVRANITAPVLAMSHDSRWLAWREGSVVRAVRLQCP